MPTDGSRPVSSQGAFSARHVRASRGFSCAIPHQQHLEGHRHGLPHPREFLTRSRMQGMGLRHSPA